MHAHHSSWRNWAGLLQRYHLREPAAVLLEASGTLSLLFAQIAHFGQPFLGTVFSKNEWEDLVHLLEDEEESKAFATFLREGTS